MHLAQHWILSWFLAEGGGCARRERRLVTAAGLLPDVDVIPYAASAVVRWLHRGMPFAAAWKSAFREVHLAVHHHYTHGIGFVAFVGLGAYLLARSGRRRAALLAACACALHVVCDVLASGPDWPVYPLWPFSGLAWGVPWSWSLADWPNLLLLALMLVAARQYAKFRGRSPLEALSARWDAAMVRLVRGGAGASGSGPVRGDPHRDLEDLPPAQAADGELESFQDQR